MAGDYWLVAAVCKAVPSGRWEFDSLATHVKVWFHYQVASRHSSQVIIHNLGWKVLDCDHPPESHTDVADAQKRIKALLIADEPDMRGHVMIDNWKLLTPVIGEEEDFRY